MDDSVARSRARYPLHACFLVAAASLLFFFNLAVGFLFMALVPPLIPVFVCILFAGGSLVGNALNYARRVSIREPAAMLRGRHEQEVGSRTIAARAA
ncbi:MAG: hypothetical protein EOO73_27115 [Myxococcales bacterium]|nr:MAG: hypothetical protein EOO73_27115 [Myxococcales bacterium]